MNSRDENDTDRDTPSALDSLELGAAVRSLLTGWVGQLDVFDAYAARLFHGEPISDDELTDLRIGLACTRSVLHALQSAQNERSVDSDASGRARRTTTRYIM